jgi:hypothetical protein
LRGGKQVRGELRETCRLDESMAQRRPAGPRDRIVQGVGPVVLDEQGDDAFAGWERLSQLAKRLLREAAAVGAQRAFGRAAPLGGLKPEADQRRDLAG